MNGKIKIFLSILIVISFYKSYSQQDEISKNVYNKENGRIILAYKAFESFLNSERSWENYQKSCLYPFPEMQYLHERNLKYGFIDSTMFRNEVMLLSGDSFKVFLDRVNDIKLIGLYDSITTSCNNYLSPLNRVDLCFYLPYGDCFMINNDKKQTIFISLKYIPEKLPLILCHEYAHCLHYQRRPQEKNYLKSSVISEGIACFMTNLILKDSSIYNGLWMMPNEAIDWCLMHENEIKDSINIEMDKEGMTVIKKFIAGGIGFADPPEGFPEKTGYFTGYRIIQACINKGIKFQELCSLNTDVIITKSGYFEP